jgi:hypothetical protein
LGGNNNLVNTNVTRSVILGGQNITATSNDTVYVPNLNIGNLGAGVSVNNLGVDVNGNVVVGTSGSTSVDTFTTGGTYDNSTALLSFTKNDSTTYDVDMSDLPLIDDVTIEVDGNNEIRLKDFVGSPTGGIRTFDGQIVITSGLTLSTLGTGTSINNLGIDVNGNVVVGTTGSTGVGGSGNLNKLAKWTPDGSTLGNSIIEDNGSNLGIGPILGSTKFRVTSDKSFGLSIQQTVNGIAAQFYSTTSGASSNVGLQTNAGGSSLVNYGVQSIVNGTGTDESIGFVTTVSSGSTNYSVQLRDGTQGTGKFLKSVTSDGKANWANITYSDISGTVPFTGNTSGDCISDLYVSNIHSCSPLNINPNNEGNVTIGQNSLIVDTTNDRIGIGKSSPTVSLDVVGDTKVSGNITTEGNLTVQGTSSTINGVNRTTYTFQTVGATTYTVGDPLQLINSSRYLKAIVVGQSTSPQNSTTAGSCGGEFINFYDAGTTFVFPNPPEQYSNLLSSTGTLSNNITDGNPQFALTLKGFTATGIANTTINWKVILEVGSL